jgi:hypothetical protein
VSDDKKDKKPRHPLVRAATSMAVGAVLAVLCHALPMPYQAACLEVSKVMQTLLGGGFGDF